MLSHYLTIKSPNLTIFGKISAKTTSDSKHPWKKAIISWDLTLEANEAIKKKQPIFNKPCITVILTKYKCILS
jgi:hypothetical protein